MMEAILNFIIPGRRVRKAQIKVKEAELERKIAQLTEITHRIEMAVLNGEADWMVHCGGDKK